MSGDSESYPTIQTPLPGAQGRWHVGFKFEHDRGGCALVPNVSNTRLATTLLFYNVFIAVCIGIPLAVMLLYTNAPAVLPIAAGSMCALIGFTAANWGGVHAFRFQRARGPVIEYRRASRLLVAPRLSFSISAADIEAIHVVRGTYHDENAQSHHVWQISIERRSGEPRFALLYSFRMVAYDKRKIEQFAHDVGRIPVKHGSEPFHKWFKLDRKHTS